VQCCFQADGETVPVQVKTEPMDDTEDTAQNSAAWSVLHDDFMMGARMKDWDKQTPDNNTVDNMSLDRHSDDDEDNASTSDDDDDS